MSGMFRPGKRRRYGVMKRRTRWLWTLSTGRVIPHPACRLTGRRRSHHLSTRSAKGEDAFFSQHPLMTACLASPPCSGTASPCRKSPPVKALSENVPQPPADTDLRCAAAIRHRRAATKQRMQLRRRQPCRAGTPGDAWTTLIFARSSCWMPLSDGKRRCATCAHRITDLFHPHGVSLMAVHRKPFMASRHVGASRARDQSGLMVP